MTAGTLLSDIIPDPTVYLQVLRFLIVLLIGLVATRFVLVPPIRYMLDRRESGPETRQTVVNLATIIGIFLSFTVALQAGNFGNLVTILGALAAALTFAIGFGMRDQISNIVAGFFIYLYNPFLVGDYIKTGVSEGVVTDITLLSTTLKGGSSQKIVVPNNQLTIEEMKNYTTDGTTKVSISLDIPYDRLQDGTELLLEIAEQHDRTLDDPSPEVHYTDSDRTIRAELHYWVQDSTASRPIKSEILDEFSARSVREGIFDEHEET